MMTVRFLLLCLLGLSVSACSEPQVPLRVKFIPSYGGERIGCERPASDGTALTDLKFFVHDLEVRDEDGVWHSASLAPQSPWQLENLALIDLENGMGSCRNGSAEQYTELDARVSVSEVTGIRFVVGVPFDQNHINPDTAAPPLTYTLMHWHWRAGYKFIRAGVSRGDKNAFVHFGSTECEGTIGNISGCAQPNRTAVELVDFDPSHHPVFVDVAALFGKELLGPCLLYTSPSPRD